MGSEKEYGGYPREKVYDARADIEALRKEVDELRKQVQELGIKCGPAILAHTRIG